MGDYFVTEPVQWEFASLEVAGDAGLSAPAVLLEEGYRPRAELEYVPPKASWRPSQLVADGFTLLVLVPLPCLLLLVSAAMSRNREQRNVWRCTDKLSGLTVGPLRGQHIRPPVAVSACPHLSRQPGLCVLLFRGVLAAPGTDVHRRLFRLPTRIDRVFSHRLVFFVCPEIGGLVAGVGASGHDIALFR